MYKLKTVYVYLLVKKKKPFYSIDRNNLSHPFRVAKMLCLYTKLTKYSSTGQRPPSVQGMKPRSEPSKVTVVSSRRGKQGRLAWQRERERNKKTKTKTSVNTSITGILYSSHTVNKHQ